MKKTMKKTMKNYKNDNEEEDNDEEKENKKEDKTYHFGMFKRLFVINKKKKELENYLNNQKNRLPGLKKEINLVGKKLQQSNDKLSKINQLFGENLIQHLQKKKFTNVTNIKVYYGIEFCRTKEYLDYISIMHDYTLADGTIYEGEMWKVITKKFEDQMWFSYLSNKIDKTSPNKSIEKKASEFRTYIFSILKQNDWYRIGKDIDKKG